jgi:virulence factor Mce-like protein
MSRQRSRAARLLDDTLVVGLAMIAAAAVILYLSFRAATGLPWESTQRIEIAVPDAGKLMRNADVRIGGARVGQVLAMEAVPREGDVPPHAVLDVQLERSAAPLPADSTAEVRLASVLGGKYVSIVPGDSERTIPDGGRLPLANAVASVDIEDALSVFGPQGRAGIRRLVGSLGDALAGRGSALNEATGETARLLPGLQRVLGTVTSASANLPGLLSGTAAAAGALGAVGPELALLTGDAASTFAALDDAGAALERSIAELPATARTATGALRELGPVLDDATAIAASLRPAADVVGDSARSVDGALRVAIGVDPALGTVAAPLQRTLGAVDAFAGNPAATNALRMLGGSDLATFGSSAFVGLGAILATTWEAEAHCRSASTWMARLGDLPSDGDEGGNWLRMIPFFQQDEQFPAARPARNAHVNPYPNQNAQECEAGNEGYAPGRAIGNPPGHQGVPGGAP